MKKKEAEPKGNSELKAQLIKHIENNDINVDEVVRNISTMTITDDSENQIGRTEYLELCTILKVKDGEIVYYHGIKVYAVTRNKFRYFLGENSYSERTLKSLLGEKDKVDNVVKYIIKNHNMKSEPALHKYCYIVNATAQEKAGFRLRKDLEQYSRDFDKWTSLACTMTSVFDSETHSYNCYIPLIKRDKADNKTINAYIKMTFKEHTQAIMDYLALYTFENRYEISRPILLLCGDRGTGKNTFVEALMSQIYMGVTSEITLGDAFNEWTDSKLAYIGEISQEGHNTTFLWDMGKQLSGQGVSKVNGKFAGKYEVSNGLYMVAMSNEPKPIHIKDQIMNEEENSLLVIKMKKNETTDADVRKFKLDINKKGYISISEYFKDHLGHWVFTDLFEHYKNLRQRIKMRPCRYGMVVPITEGLIEIVQMSVSGVDASILKCVEDLFYQNYSPYNLSDEDERVFKMFSSATETGIKGFIPLSIIGKMANTNKTDFYVTFIKFLRKRGWLLNGDIQVNPFTESIGSSKPKNGIIVNVQKVANYFEERNADSRRKLDQYKNNDDFKNNFTSEKYFGSSNDIKEPALVERDYKKEAAEIEDLL